MAERATDNMAEISLRLTGVNVSVGHSVGVEQPQTLNKDFESVELDGLEEEAEEVEQEVQQREKAPRRIIHFSSGETMEEYSTDEEEAEDTEPERKDLLPAPADLSKLTWGPYFLFHMWRAATSTVSACDYLGERMASLFGITSAKYQYAIDEYYRMKKEKEEEKEENRLSEEAEHQLRSQDEWDEPITVIEQQSDHGVAYQIANDNPPPQVSVSVLAAVPANS